MSPERGVKPVYTEEQLNQFHKTRLSVSADIATYSLPQLPESKAYEVFDRLLEARARLIGNNDSISDYQQGTALSDDHLLVEDTGGSVLLTAEHATNRMRFSKKEQVRKPMDADFGTGELSWLIYEDTGSNLILPRGRQTMDANDDLEHPLKNHMRTIIFRPQTIAHASIHGMLRGRVSAVDDQRAYSVILGIGNEPSEQTLLAVEAAKQIANKYGLRLGVNIETLRFLPGTGIPQRRQDGTLSTIAFAAKGSGTTRSFAQNIANKAGKLRFAASQIELSAEFLLKPSDYNLGLPQKAKRMATYIGYLFTKEYIEFQKTS